MKHPSTKLNKRITVSVNQKLFDELDWWVEHSESNKSVLLRNLIANWIMAQMAVNCDEVKDALAHTSYTEDGLAYSRVYKND